MFFEREKKVLNCSLGLCSLRLALFPQGKFNTLRWAVTAREGSSRLGVFIRFTSPFFFG